MSKALIFAAIGEAITGLALLIAPQLVGRLLFDQDLAGVALPIARIAGIELIGLGVACWPGPAVGGMLFYSIAVALYLSYLGLFAGLTGVLLWPAIALHAFLAALLGRVWLVCNQRSSGGDRSPVQDRHNQPISRALRLRTPLPRQRVRSL